MERAASYPWLCHRGLGNGARGTRTPDLLGAIQALVRFEFRRFAGIFVADADLGESWISAEFAGFHGISVTRSGPRDEIRPCVAPRHASQLGRAVAVLGVRGTLMLMAFDRITIRPDQMAGTACIRGLRIPVATVVGMVADGLSQAEILDAYPDLEADDVRQALLYAAEAVRERELPLAG